MKDPIVPIKPNLHVYKGPKTPKAQSYQYAAEEEIDPHVGQSLSPPLLSPAKTLPSDPQQQETARRCFVFLQPAAARELA
jgi:hypothetical protein